MPANMTSLAGPSRLAGCGGPSTAGIRKVVPQPTICVRAEADGREDGPESLGGRDHAARDCSG